MTYQIIIEPTALEMLASIPDKRIQQKIAKRIDELIHDPEKQGKPLIDNLAGFRSLRAIGQRYRIIYKIEKSKVIVFIVAIGIRKEGDKKDIYALAKKLIRLRLI